MRPKLLERFDGVVCDWDDGGETFFLINTDKGEQMEIPRHHVRRCVRERLSENAPAYLLIYDGRIDIRIPKYKNWTKASWKEHLKRTKRWVRKHWNFSNNPTP